ncbi:ABC transporter B family member 2-like isoform X1 [Iris pallida]|uniref:ABC transporter B family member 2-like isoform X1 n=1 Tax=Iris pallida TaxID=29817 RepID=A0AAX6EQR4_IRIPA|nr:ABC transporter B family member 2-like isoform X1 [Iris pallida]KAJ6821387.1 ABC transporter B family member 2-like isoform X1 [Iris pallida]
MSRSIVGFTIGFTYVWQLTLVSLSTLPFIAISGVIYAYIATKLVAKVRKSYVKAGNIAEEVIGNVRTVQAFGGEEKAAKAYNDALLETYEYGKKGGLVKGLGIGSIYAVLFFSWALLVWYSSIVVHKKLANGADSVSTMLIAVMAALSLGLSAPNLFVFIRARTVAYPIFKMIDRNPMNKESAEQGKSVSSLNGHIQFSKVSFSYPSRPGALVLDAFNLDIPSGKIIALVGKSGSGKSTVISLIERFYEPLSGAILLDGHNINDLDIKWLRAQIGLVSQEPTLFATSILENILYGKANARPNEIDHATTLSGAISFINNLPDKYETQVGERGVQLSGGQKQRIAISRAIIKNPKILLLDEATSSLDAESERSIQQALDLVMVGRTTVVVAHRLSTIRNADVIAVVDGGKIVESGTHDVLMQDPLSAYASLVRQQEAVSQRPSSWESASIAQNVRVSEELSIGEKSLGSSILCDKDSIDSSPPEINGRTKAKPAPLRRLYSMAWPDWPHGVLGTGCALVSAILPPLFSLGLAHALVSYYKDWETTQRETKKIVFFYCASAVITFVIHIAEHLSFSIIGERLTLRVREQIFRAILRNEIGWFDETSNISSILLSRLETDASLLQLIIVDRSATLLQNMGMIVCSFIIAFILNWRITAVILATYPLIVGGALSEQLFMKGFGGNLRKAYMRASMCAVEGVSNIRTVAAFCSEEKVVGLYARELQVPSRSSFQRGLITGFFYGISQFCLYSSYALSMWYSSVLIDKGLASYEVIIKSYIVLVVTSYAVADALTLAPDITKGNRTAASVFELMDRKTKVACDVGEDISTVRGVIEIKGVEFRYPSRPEVVVFKGFDLRVGAGMSMALIGTSGSGKSTVIALILRFYDPTQGKVLIDGKDIKELRLASLRKHIGLVQQEPVLFATTIYDNILFGKDDATEADVVEASKLANAHSFISALPEGYSTRVGERGVQLSGGQKQRVAIARAIIKNPAILLLDEATSALDAESERVVQRALDKVMEGRTTVVVAHRLSTIRNVDVISVLQGGKIVEQGSHSSLMENHGGAYHNMILLQQNKSSSAY